MRRTAAVAIAIFREPPHGIVFVERAKHLRDHPGQIGLPGGGIHPEDPDLRATALRELHEEVGISPKLATIVGQLPTLRQVRVNNFDVTPFVAVVENVELTIDPSETAGVFVVPLRTVLEDGLRETHVEVGEARVRSFVFDFEGRRIWGLTARILRDFLTAWNGDDLRERIAAHAVGELP